MSSSADPVSAVQHYIEAFNRADTKAMAAMCTDPMSILDVLAPHVWHGSTPCLDWFRAVMVEAEQVGAKDYKISLDKPLHASVTGNVAYLVVPVTMTFNLRNKRVTQSGAVFTVALRKLPAGWRIASWAWARGATSVS
jgi:ketosteroid isomerase-like protein